VKKKPIVVENQPEVTINIRIESLIDSHLVYDGQVTGRHYEWMKAGAIVEVDEKDAPFLLKKRLGKKTCCGQNERNIIFQLAN
jgi:hypothetical protein